MEQYRGTRCPRRESARVDMEHGRPTTPHDRPSSAPITMVPSRSRTNMTPPHKPARARPITFPAVLVSRRYRRSPALVSSTRTEIRASTSISRVLTSVPKVLSRSPTADRHGEPCAPPNPHPPKRRHRNPGERDGACGRPSRVRQVDGSAARERSRSSGWFGGRRRSRHQCAGIELDDSILLATTARVLAQRPWWSEWHLDVRRLHGRSPPSAGAHVRYHGCISGAATPWRGGPARHDRRPDDRRGRRARRGRRRLCRRRRFGVQLLLAAPGHSGVSLTNVVAYMQRRMNATTIANERGMRPIRLSGCSSGAFVPLGGHRRSDPGSVCSTGAPLRLAQTVQGSGRRSWRGRISMAAEAFSASSATLSWPCATGMKRIGRWGSARTSSSARFYSSGPADDDEGRAEFAVPDIVWHVPATTRCPVIIEAMTMGFRSIGERMHPFDRWEIKVSK